MPHGFIGEVVGELFEGEEDAANGGAEGDGDAGGRGGGEDFTFAGFVLVQGGEELHEDVCAAAGDMDEGAFFTEPES